VNISLSNLLSTLKKIIL